MKTQGNRRRKKGVSPSRKAIAKVWKDLLGCRAVAPGSDFFDLGGDSILALNMLFEVGDALGVELPPGVLFENPQFGSFCAAVEGLRLETGLAARR